MLLKYKIVPVSLAQTLSFLPGGSKNPSLHQARQRSLAAWLAWLFGSLVVPLIRAHFYVTETEALRQHVLYYRHVEPSAFYGLKFIGACSQATVQHRPAKTGYSSSMDVT